MPEDLGAGRMIRKRKMQFLMGKAAGSLCVLCISPAAIAAGTSSLSGQERWQPYLDAAPQSAEEFSCAPLETILSFLPENPLRFLTQIAQNYADVFLFLLLLIVLSFLLGESRNADLLELVSAAGTGVFLWSTLAELAQRICAGMEYWKNYLTGFLPVYSGVLIAGGEANAGASACGLLLSGLCLLAQGTALWLEPLLQSYLAISMACCISSQKGLADSCRMVGSLLRKGLIWTGKLFAAVSGHISAGQYFSSCESSADRERSGRRRDIEQRFGNHSSWTSFVEKFAGAGLSGRSGGRICAIVLHPDASSAVSAWVRTALRTFRESLLQCAA